MMSAKDLTAARRALGLSVRDFATMLGCSPQHVRRMETQPGRPQHRRITGTTARLVRAYLSGYRPGDWPSRPGER
jgi:DNA-binding transcriptional regulator YiaG